MLTSVLNYAMSATNYSVTNVNNMYNFILSLMDDLTDDQKQKLIDKMIIQVGRSFYRNFRLYVMDKVPDSKHLDIINRIV